MPVAPEYAFPFEHHQKFSLDNPTISSPGVSKREYIASRVLQGIVSNPQTPLAICLLSNDRLWSIRRCCWQMICWRPSALS